MEQEAKTPDAKPTIEKKTYRSPELLEYGALTRLTTGSKSGAIDGASTMMVA